jgi:hypothetical protein
MHYLLFVVKLPRQEKQKNAAKKIRKKMNRYSLASNLGLKLQA